MASRRVQLDASEQLLLDHYRAMRGESKHVVRMVAHRLALVDAVPPNEPREQEFGVPDDENPEWTAEEIRTAKPFEEVFPDIAAQVIAGRTRRRRQAPKKA